jgi:hypothetical protein
MSNPSATLRHIVLFSFKDDAGAEQVQSIVDGFRALPAAIPGIVSYEWGVDVSPEGLSEGFTHCFMLSFASAADRDTYLAHPEHQRFVGTLENALERSLVLDYWAQ